ncbi:hypothetical protein GCM10008931_43970 [Oceanobacillus oncorhynchi subsp. oncorhynchi]|uniref:hypothetical protein n=1 Tax=Oceanobacillus oncorhynchi TaxID=545501 RepID=UPI0031D87FA6
MKIYNNNRGLKLFIGGRASGKTTRAIERLKEYPSAYLIVPYSQMKKHLYSEIKDQHRILTFDEFLSLEGIQGKKKVILDECFHYSDVLLAELYYTLGQLDVEVIGFGTPRGEEGVDNNNPVSLENHKVLSPAFFKGLSEFDTAILKRYNNKPFLVFNNGELNGDIESVEIYDKQGYVKIL